MTDLPGDEVLRFYESCAEADRLGEDTGPLELERTREIIARNLLRAPSRVLDIGGGAGVYTSWLGSLGHETHLVDPVSLHIEQARERSAATGDTIASFSIGDACDIRFADASADVVLLMGPLYHLTERADRLLALREAYRVLVPGGRLFAVVISRYASLLDGLRRDILGDPEYASIVEKDLATGVHVNTTDRVDFLTTAYFHEPTEIEAELAEVGFVLDELLGIEGPGWLLPDLSRRWEDADLRDAILATARTLERVPAALAMSGHIMAVARRPEVSPLG